ncbi:uncharacterized protein FIESC28_09785 [Fusarium coffeatum]|uniref:C2H2-type domain-containing protein n=1 Tax=Fusarium coffeatum TaxID=231269 RepID=A0A366R078_9HYPO|nr:uncharacterized protein FIESC28_09785 [Fusarium coffeatum]RBR09615.1 hypothetical protein FIESC28_09785 [Fusarium coffeatum]
MAHTYDTERDIDARKFNLYVLLPNYFPFGTLTSKEPRFKPPIHRVYEDVYHPKSNKSASFQQRSYFPDYLSLGSRMASKFRKIDRAARLSITNTLENTREHSVYSIENGHLHEAYQGSVITDQRSQETFKLYSTEAADDRRRETGRGVGCTEKGSKSTSCSRANYVSATFHELTTASSQAQLSAQPSVPLQTTNATQPTSNPAISLPTGQGNSNARFSRAMVLLPRNSAIHMEPVTLNEDVPNINLIPDLRKVEKIPYDACVLPCGNFSTYGAALPNLDVLPLDDRATDDQKREMSHYRDVIDTLLTMQQGVYTMCLYDECGQVFKKQHQVDKHIKSAHPGLTGTGDSGTADGDVPSLTETRVSVQAKCQS